MEDRGPSRIVDGPKINLLLIRHHCGVQVCYVDIQIVDKVIDKVGHDLIQHMGINTHSII